MATVIDIESRTALRTARWLAEKHSFAVFPLYEPIAGADGLLICSCPGGRECRNPGKHPRTPNGCKAATTDLAQITAWWTRWPNANIGLATGLASGLVVLDIDPRNHGDATFAELVERHGDLPATPALRTGGDGFHLYFRRPNEPRVAGRPLGAGVDVKADGGYVVAHSSLHVAGKRYEFQADRGLDATPIADLPDWVAAVIVGDKPRQTGGASQAVLDGFMGVAFQVAGWLGRYLGPNKATVRCPWEDEHTSGTRGDSSTVVFGPTEGYRAGWVHCSHSHCANRTQAEFAAMLPEAAKREARERLKLSADYTPPPGHSAPPPDDAEAADVTWQLALSHNLEGKMQKDPGNCAILLANLPEWRGCLAYDEFADRVFWDRPVPSMPGMVPPALDANVADEHVVYVQQWFAVHRKVSFTKQAVQDALVAAARRNRRHPLREYLARLEWDRLPRLSTWLTDYLGAEDSDYVRAVGRMWMISAVVRAIEPGRQVDHMLVLEGGQGSGKSSAVRILAKDWFLGTLPDLRTKDAALALVGSWIVEIGELDAFRGAASTRVKDFVTQPVDTYRPPYGRFNVRWPRSCVFVGTTNDEHWSKDPTGGRRFWPVRVEALAREALERDCDQLWAEAVHAYNAGESWWPQSDINAAISAEQEERFDVDEWEGPISSWLVGRSRDGATIGEVMSGALQIDVERWTRGDQMRVATILRRIGWQKPRTEMRRTGGRERLWFPVTTVEVGNEDF